MQSILMLHTMCPYVLTILTAWGRRPLEDDCEGGAACTAVAILFGFICRCCSVRRVAVLCFLELLTCKSRVCALSHGNRARAFQSAMAWGLHFAKNGTPKSSAYQGPSRSTKLVCRFEARDQLPCWSPPSSQVTSRWLDPKTTNDESLSEAELALEQIQILQATTELLKARRNLKRKSKLPLSYLGIPVSSASRPSFLAPKPPGFGKYCCQLLPRTGLRPSLSLWWACLWKKNITLVLRSSLDRCALVLESHNKRRLGNMWNILKSIEKFWNILKSIEKYWKVLKSIEMYWNVLKCMYVCMYVCMYAWMYVGRYVGM